MTIESKMTIGSKRYRRVQARGAGVLENTCMPL